MIFYSLFSSVGFSNTYLLGPKGGGDAVLIDPGVFDVPLLRAVEGNKLSLKWILVTHGHAAHVAGIKTLLKVYDAEIYCNHPSSLDFPAHHIQDGDRLELGQMAFHVMETPGHSN